MFRGDVVKKSLAAAFVLAVLTTGCSTVPSELRGYRDFGVRMTNMAFANVQVAADATIVVSQEPIFVRQDTDNAIYWQLPSGGPYYFLPKDSKFPGIVFDHPQMPQTSCDNNNKDPYTYICTYKKAERKKYTYTIQVTKDGTNVLKSDPTVMNN